MARVNTDEILKPVDAAENARREERVRKGLWPTLRKAAAYVPFAEEVVAGYYCALDPKTPFRTRGILLAALAYFVLPFDIVPDFILGVGFTDDLAVLTAAISAIRGQIQPRHRAAAKQALAERA
ncbi:YkvA family protein [Tianweitania sp.]|uniref:YkvA family protein n=1 Tax=Tianweitania sp. TaxID=2021634 RepID=UPI0028A2D5F7|nr:YkvA family protein [Tianweitania sp.]